MGVGSWVRLAVVGLGSALAWGTVAPGTARAEETLPKPIYFNKARFRVPFHVNQADRVRLRNIQLWVSEDQGRRWKKFDHAAPDQTSFLFRAAHDAEYWITVRTEDTQGHLYPSDEKEVTPGLVVVVDTVAPSLILEARPRRGSQASVRWEAGDKNLDVSSFLLEYQVEGARDWRRVPNVRPATFGVATWDAGTADALRVRAAVADRAGNRKQAELALPEGIAADPGLAAEPSELAEPPPIVPASSGPKEAAPDPVAQAAPADPGSGPDPAPGASESRADRAEGAAPPGDAPTLLVGSPRFPLQYAVDDAGPRGPAVVELWATRDGGRTWSRIGRDPDCVSPFPVDLGGEGTFGLKLVARAGSGLGDTPPVPGEAPQSWVEVDLTPPAVRLDTPKVGSGAEAGKLVITWRAADPHLGPRPVVLSYRPDRPDAIWQQITGPIPNTGRHEWALPANVAPRFHLRIDVLDTVGNRGSAEAGPIVIDRTRPRGRILGLDPSAQAGARSKW